MSNIISAENLTLWYEENEIIINSANFSINKGDFVFITGPSGSGKSTLLQSFYGKLQPNHGSLNIGGLDMTNIKKKSYKSYEAI